MTTWGDVLTSFLAVAGVLGALLAGLVGLLAWWRRPRHPAPGERS
jgi:hypothetical protein